MKRTWKNKVKNKIKKGKRKTVNKRGGMNTFLRMGSVSRITDVDGKIKGFKDSVKQERKTTSQTTSQTTTQSTNQSSSPGSTKENPIIIGTVNSYDSDTSFLNGIDEANVHKETKERILQIFNEIFEKYHNCAIF
jgi:hypothetical protein